MSHSDAHPATSDHKAHHGVGHVVSMKVLITIFSALLVLTVLTVEVSVHAVDWHISSISLYVALAVAALKASLVVLYFMHLRYDKPFNAVVFVGCLIFVAIFISLAMTDSRAYRSTVSTNEAGGMEKVHSLMAAPPGGAPPAEPK